MKTLIAKIKEKYEEVNGVGSWQKSLNENIEVPKELLELAERKNGFDYIPPTR